MRRLALVLALALAGGGALAACDNDGGNGAQGGGESTDAGPTDGGGDPEDQALADDIVLTEADVPEGFVVQEDDDEDDDFSEDDALADCVDPELLEELEAIENGESGGSAESAFESEDGELVVGSGALVLSDGESAAEFFELFSGGCFEDAFLEAFSGESTDEAEFSDVTIDAIEDLPATGDAIEGFTVQATTVGIELSLEFVVIQTGRAVTFVFTAGLGESFPTADRDAAIETVAERMEAAA